MLQNYIKDKKTHTPRSALNDTRGNLMRIKGINMALREQKNIIIVLCVLLVTTFARASSPELAAIRDSLREFRLGWTEEAIADRLKVASDSDEIYALYAESMTCRYYLGDPDSVVSLARRCNDYVGRNGENPALREIRLRALRALGAVYTQYVSQPDSAIHYQQLALKASDPDNMVEWLVSYGNLADAYKYAGDYVNSIATYREAILKADSAGVDPYGRLDLYCGLAACYTDLRDFEDSGEWWDTAERLWLQMNKTDKSRYLNNRGNDYFYQKDYDGALRMFLRLDSLCADDSDLDWDRLLCHVNLSDVYLKLGETDKACQLIGETDSFFTKVQPNPAVISYIRTQEMDLLRQQGDHEGVERLIRDNPLPEGIRPDQAVLRLDFLRKYYREKHDYRLALEYEDRYRHLDDSLRDERIRLKSAELESRYLRDATILHQQVAISEKEAHLMRTYVIAAIALLGIVLLTAVILIQRIQRRNEARRFRDNIIEMRMENNRNRITPHFIYNALNHEILAREKGEPTRMPVLVDLLRRGQLLASDLCISLDKELEFIDLYLDVEKNVTGPVDYHVDVAGNIDLRRVMLPSMTIQIFVENAVKHAFRLMTPGMRRLLEIKVSDTGESTLIEITNNGLAESVNPSKDSTGTGMRVIFQTIQMLNERNRRKIELTIDHTDTCGNERLYTVRLSIPHGFDFTSPYNQKHK